MDTCNDNRLVNEGQNYTASVTINNDVGSSSMIMSDSFGKIYYVNIFSMIIVTDATWLRLTGSNTYSTAQCVVDGGFFINVTYTNETLPNPTSVTISYVANTTGSVDVPGDNVTYTLQVFNSNGPVGSSVVGFYSSVSLATATITTGNYRLFWHAVMLPNSILLFSLK